MYLSDFKLATCHPVLQKHIELLRELNDTIHKKHLVWRLVQNKHTRMLEVPSKFPG